LGTISPRIYGHFTEHIGRLIYEGIWVGPESKIPNIAGFRADVLNALKRVRPAVVRWPGGCFADAYHWEDGVGPPAKRPVRNNHWWLRTETNAFGTDEFLRWCELVSAEPYLSPNLGSGSVEEALNWIEYCNGSGESEYAAMRVRNGRSKPHGVRWWGIGNENWGCGGMFTPSEYAQLFRQYAVYIKRLGMSSDSELVGVGHTADNWNRRFLEAAGAALPYLDHLSVHRYFRRGHSTKFTDAEYMSLMSDLTAFDSLIRDCLAAIDEVEPRRAKIPVFGKMPRKPMGLILDEWGVWHDDAHIDDGFSQNGTLRDAIFAASCLNLFHRYAARITMTNIAQAINCLQSLILTSGARMILTPTFHVYEMYRAHQGAKSLRVDLSDGPMLSASASRSGKSFLITLVNQDPTEDSEVRIDLRGARVREARAMSLTGPNVRAANTTDQADAVTARPWKADIAGGELRARVPARSVQAITAT
jgi:alpha-N-arabinofuranosidase